MATVFGRGARNFRIKTGGAAQFLNLLAIPPDVDLAGSESDVILSVPSRFEGGSDGRDGDWIFWRCTAKKNGALFMQRVTERQAVCLRALSDDRAEQVKFRRFLSNEAVTVEEMVAHRAMFVAATVTGRHVLAIQDTSEINYQAQVGRKRRLG